MFKAGPGVDLAMKSLTERRCGTDQWRQNFVTSDHSMEPAKSLHFTSSMNSTIRRNQFAYLILTHLGWSCGKITIPGPYPRSLFKMFWSEDLARYSSLARRRSEMSGSSVTDSSVELKLRFRTLLQTQVDHIDPVPVCQSTIILQFYIRSEVGLAVGDWKDEKHLGKSCFWFDPSPRWSGR